MTQPNLNSSPDEALFNYLEVRRRTLALSAPLCAEDQVVQSMPDASPTKWHLAHTSWFFERFVLAEFVPHYTPVNDHYFYLFNSYYNSVGPMHKRAQRGLLSRPTVAEVQDYRATIDQRMMDWLDYTHLSPAQSQVLTLGLHHEQQHQELIMTDIKHAFAQNPMLPVYQELPVAPSQFRDVGFVSVDAHNIEMGFVGDSFAFDNETPRHATHMHAHQLGNRLVTNGEYRQFVQDKGYANPDLWLSEAWAVVQEQNWQRPIYWQEDLHREFTLAGVRELDVNAPVCHLSLYEADAFARWAGARLPTEAELEFAACRQEKIDGNFYERGFLHPVALSENANSYAVHQLFGDVWEWTSSSYGPYPGFKPLAGSLGEYNGKFMCGQQVLRGGSCVSPQSHLRCTYRNFFYPAARWQFSGLRLAKDN